MIAGFVRGQTLRLSVPRIAADTIDYLTAKFLFQSSDWDGLEKWVHFALGDAAYDIRLTDDEITADAHLNLAAGKWTVYLHGNRYADGKVVQRVTTETQTLDVLPTGTLDGEPFPTVPPSAGEQIIASAEAAEAGAKAAAAEARQAADEAAAYEPEVFWAEYGVTAFADVAAAYDAGKLCGVRYLNLRFIAARTSYATERFIEFTGTSYYRDHYMIRVTASDRWSIYEEELLTRRFDVAENIEVDPDSTEVPTVKAVYEAIQTYSDPAIVEALRKAKESGEFDGEPGENGITPHIGANGNWYVGETDTGIPAQGDPGNDYVLTDADKQEIAGMIPGGGSGDNTLVVTVTSSDGVTTADHTFDEIHAAFTEKKKVVAYYNNLWYTEFREAKNANGEFLYYNFSAVYTSVNLVRNSIQFYADGRISRMSSNPQTATMVGASDTEYGESGIVPMPWKGQQDHILRGDGTWKAPTETISSSSTDSEIPTAKAVYDAIQNSGGKAGMVVFTVAYIDGAAMMLDDPMLYPEGADIMALLTAGQARMLVIEPSDSEDAFAKKLGVLELFFLDTDNGALQFAGTITGVNGNEAVMAELSLETNEITIVPAVQNSAGSGSSGGGGVVTITDNGDGTYSSSHTPTEIAAMAETGAVVAAAQGGVIPLLQYDADMAVFSLFMLEDDMAGQGAFVVTNDGALFDTISYYVGEMHGADTDNDGTGGTVPAPSAGQQDAVLHGDGTWRAALSEEDKMELVTRVLEKLPTWDGGTY